MRGGDGTYSILMNSIFALKTSWENAVASLIAEIESAKATKNEGLLHEKEIERERYASEIFKKEREIDHFLIWVNIQKEHIELHNIEYEKLLPMYLDRDKPNVYFKNEIKSFLYQNTNTLHDLILTPVLVRAYELIEPFTLSLKIVLSRESRSKIAIVAAAIAIRNKRDEPTKEDILNALGEMSDNCNK